MAPEVRSSFLASDRTYGARWVWHDLLAACLRHGLHKIERLMLGQTLRARLRRRGLPNDHGERYPDRCRPTSLIGSSQPQFAAIRRKQKWVADFTYVWTTEGWLYAAVVIDLFSRRVTGLSMSSSMNEQLVADALVMAISRRGSFKQCSIAPTAAASLGSTGRRNSSAAKIAASRNNAAIACGSQRDGSASSTVTVDGG